MKVYRADPAAVDAFMRRRRCTGLIVWPILMAGGVALLAADALLRGFLTGTFVEPAKLAIWACVVAFFGFAMLVAAYPLPYVRAWRASYMLEVTDDDLRRYRDGLSPYTVHRSEVVRISEESSGIVVLTATGWKLNIPRYLEGYDEVRETLRGWCPIETGTARNALLIAISIAISIAWVGGFMAVQFVPPVGRGGDRVPGSAGMDDPQFAHGSAERGSHRDPAVCGRLRDRRLHHLTRVGPDRPAWRVGELRLESCACAGASPMLYDNAGKDVAEAVRSSVVAKAQRSPIRHRQTNLWRQLQPVSQRLHVRCGCRGEQQASRESAVDNRTKHEQYSLSVHEEENMIRVVVEEAAELASITLFVGMIAIWADVLSSGM